MRNNLKIYLSLFIVIVTFSQCGSNDVPPYTPPNDVVVKEFCGKGKSYLDLPKPLLEQLKSLSKDRVNGGTTVRQYEFEGETYFEVNIPVSSYSVGGLYNCQGDDLLPLYKKIPRDTKLKDYASKKKLIQLVWEWLP